MAACFFLDMKQEKENSNLFLDVILCVINFISGITAIGSNSLVLGSILRTPSLKSNPNTLLLCLAVSDLFVGLLVQFSYITYRIFLHTGAPEITCVTGIVFEITGWFVSAVTFFTLFTISVERYIAISFPLRYNHIITGKRVLETFLGIVLFSGALALFRLFVINNRVLRTINAVLIPAIFITFFCLYYKIFLVVKKKRLENHKIRMTIIANAYSVEMHLAKSELKRFTKSVITMVCIGVLFFTCYIPFFCTMIAYLVLGETRLVSMFYYITLTIIFLSSSLNPFLYCFRMSPIRIAMKKTFAEVMKCLKIPYN